MFVSSSSSKAALTFHWINFLLSSADLSLQSFDDFLQSSLMIYLDNHRSLGSIEGYSAGLSSILLTPGSEPRIILRTIIVNIIKSLDITTIGVDRDKGRGSMTK